MVLVLVLVMAWWWVNNNNVRMEKALTQVSSEIRVWTQSCSLFGLRALEPDVCLCVLFLTYLERLGGLLLVLLRFALSCLFMVTVSFCLRVKKMTSFTRE